MTSFSLAFGIDSITAPELQHDFIPHFENTAKVMFVADGPGTTLFSDPLGKSDIDRR